MPILDPGIIALVLALASPDAFPHPTPSPPLRASPCGSKTPTTAFDCCVRLADANPEASPPAPRFTAAHIAQERMTGDVDPS